MFVSEHDDDALATVAEAVQPAKDQSTADPAPLMVRQNGQRRQCNCAYISMRRLYRHSTEQNVTHDKVLRLRYERKQNVSACS
jgi:hypothetical protein